MNVISMRNGKPVWQKADVVVMNVVLVNGEKMDGINSI